MEGIHAQAMAPEQPAQQSAGCTPARGRSVDRVLSGPIALDDKNKAYDAIIIAAGIVAVLIANVAYLGAVNGVIRVKVWGMVLMYLVTSSVTPVIGLSFAGREAGLIGNRVECLTACVPKEN